jgi:hypothetical protein
MPSKRSSSDRVRDHLPGIEGASEAVLRSLLRFCPICDAFEAIDKRPSPMTAIWQAMWFADSSPPPLKAPSPRRTFITSFVLVSVVADSDLLPSAMDGAPQPEHAFAR